MFNATYFTYDGVHSSQYGLMLADFDNNPVVETTAFSPVLNTVKPAQLKRFIHTGITYDTPPQYQFSVIKATPISLQERRTILSWLVGRSEFKKLVIDHDDFRDYYYNCVFTDTDIIYINGRCHGFRVTANFDSNYASAPAVSNFVEITWGDGRPLLQYEMEINNPSDVEGYVYPIVALSGVGYVYDGNFRDDNVIISNLTDEALIGAPRPFVISGVAASASKKISINNELRTITSTSSDVTIQNFNKNWLRLAPGNNQLQISCAAPAERYPCTVMIICPNYVKIGF